MTTKTAHRRVAAFERQYGPVTRRLASHAALPAVLNAELVHLLRINYFLEPPDWLPYTSEADLLLSPLCSEMDDTLYVIDPDVRELLLENLVAEDGPARVQNVARLLWEYTQRHNPWPDRPGLAEAQQLTSLNFVDPEKAKAWLDAAEQATKAGTFSDRRWFVAMRKELQWTAKAIVPKQILSRDTAIIGLRDVLARLYPDEDDQIPIVSSAGLVPWEIAFSTMAVDTWAFILEEATLANKVDEVLALVRSDYPRYQPLLDAIAAYEQVPITPTTQTMPQPEKKPTAVKQVAFDQALINLRDALAGTFYRKHQIRRVVRDAGLDERYISFSARAIDTWTSILEQAVIENRVGNLRAVARSEYPNMVVFAADEDVLETSLAATEPQPEEKPTTTQRVTSHQALIELRNALTELYWRAPESRRIVREAGLKEELISLSIEPLAFWASIVKQAVLENRLDKVLAIARNEYPLYQPLIDAIVTYEQVLESSPTEARPQPEEKTMALEQVPSYQRALTELKETLAGLYPDQDTARRICLFADLDIRRISFGARSVDTWTAVLEEAEKQGRMSSLLFVVIVDYPVYGPLTTAVANYVSASGIDLPPILYTTLAIEDEKDRTEAFYNLAEESNTQGVNAALALEDEDDRARSLSALVPRIPSKLLAQVMAGALEIANEHLRTMVLVAMARTLASYAKDIKGRGLGATLGIWDEQLLAHALMALAPHLSAVLGLPGLTIDLAAMNEQLRAMVVMRLLDTALQFPGSWIRDPALAALAPQLSGDLLAQGLAAALAIWHEEYRAQALEALAPQLSGDLLAQGLAAALDLRDEKYRAQALEALAPQLSGDFLAQGLAAAMDLRDEKYRTQTLEALAPQLSGDLLAQSLAAALDLRDEKYRAQALWALAPQLSGDLLAQGLAAALDLRDEQSRAQALAALAPQLSGEEKTYALAAALAIRDRKSRAEALTALAPQLSGEEKAYALAQGLTTALAIQDELYRAQALTALVPYLSGNHKAQAVAQGLAAAQTIKDERSRAEVLGALAPYLSEELLAQGLNAAESKSDPTP